MDSLDPILKQQLIDLLTFMVVGGGAGLFSYWLFNILRDAVKYPEVPPDNLILRGIIRWWYERFAIPVNARFTVIWMTTIIGGGCKFLLDYLTGESQNMVWSALATAFFTFMVSQILHGIKSLPTSVTTESPEA